MDESERVKQMAKVELDDNFFEEFKNSEDRSRTDLGEGENLVALTEFVTKKSEDYGVIVAIKGMVVEGEHAPNTIVSHAFFVGKSKQKGGDSEKAKLKQFVGALIGETDPDIVTQKMRALYNAQDTQPAKGMLFKSFGTYSGHTNGEGRRYFNQVFTHVDQTKEDIKAMRERIDSGRPVSDAKPKAAKEAPAQAPSPEAVSDGNFDAFLD